MRYFRIQDSGQVLTRAFLAPPETIDGEYVDVWQFTNGKHVDSRSLLRMGKRIEGPVLPFSMAAYEIPVVDHLVGNVFQEEAGRDVQLIPVEVKGECSRYSILNVACVVDCIDERNSEFSKYSLDDEAIEPALRGQFEVITRLKIEPQKAAGHAVFRIDGWLTPLIVSDSVRHRLAEMDLPGTEFTPV
jgi:hypothetical protein